MPRQARQSPQRPRPGRDPVQQLQREWGELLIVFPEGRRWLWLVISMAIRVIWRLTLPILAIGGQYSLGDQVAATMKLAADDVQTLVIPGCAHWVAEETPEEILAALTAFLAPTGTGRPRRNPRKHDAARQPLAAGDAASARAAAGCLWLSARSARG